jgi:hypothetical protein
MGKVYRKRHPYKRFKWWKSGRAWKGNEGRIALAKVRKLERKVEPKFFSIAVNTVSNIALAGTVIHLAAILQGDSHSERIGNQIAPFFLNMRLRWIGDVAGDSDIYRTIIFRDKRQVLATPPVLANVLNGANVLEQMNPSTRHRYKILFDQTYTQANDAAIRLSVFYHIKLKLYLKMGWSNSVAANINMNGLYMILIHDQSAAFPDVQYSSRLFYNDA